MDTGSGRIFSPEEMAMYSDAKIPGAEIAFEEFKAEHRETLDAIARADDAGRLVPVSDRVAQTMKVGQREMERRQRRRKAARAARRVQRRG